MAKLLLLDSAFASASRARARSATSSLAPLALAPLLALAPRSVLAVMINIVSASPSLLDHACYIKLSGPVSGPRV
eukprot:2421489-Pyramimonas_sp.AAC.2